MKPIRTEKLATLVPKDQFSKGVQAAREKAEAYERVTFSLQGRHVSMIKKHALAMANERGETVNNSEALRDLLDGKQS